MREKWLEGRGRQRGREGGRWSPRSSPAYMAGPHKHVSGPRQQPGKTPLTSRVTLGRLTLRPLKSVVTLAVSAAILQTHLGSPLRLGPSRQNSHLCTHMRMRAVAYSLSLLLPPSLRPSISFPSPLSPPPFLSPLHPFPHLYLSIYLSINQSTYLYYLSIYLPVCLSAYLSHIHTQSKLRTPLALPSQEPSEKADICGDEQTAGSCVASIYRLRS